MTYICAVEDSNQREQRLLQDIEAEQGAAAAAAARYNRQNNCAHHLRLGYRVRITNLRNEYNMEGMVTHVSLCMVKLRDNQGNYYSCAHWNLGRIIKPQNAQ